MTNGQLMDRLTRRAREYRPGCEASLARNKHMHVFRGAFDEALADAVLVDFLNFVAYHQGMDLGMYAVDLQPKTTDAP